MSIRATCSASHTSFRYCSFVFEPSLTDLTHHISPHCATTTSVAGLSPRSRVFSTFRTTSIPSTTLPKTTCLLFRNGVGTVVMKNCDPLVSGPEFYYQSATLDPRCREFSAKVTKRVKYTKIQVRLTAMLSKPAASCFNLKFSSAKDLVPYMHALPVPSPKMKSPPWIIKSLI